VSDQWNHIIGLPHKSNAPDSFRRYHQYTERDLEAARRASNVDWRAKGAVSSVKDQVRADVRLLKYVQLTV
jgi:hypothetical protein